MSKYSWEVPSRWWLSYNYPWQTLQRSQNDIFSTWKRKHIGNKVETVAFAATIYLMAEMNDNSSCKSKKLTNNPNLMMVSKL